jgi:hypothetical protein
VAPGETVCLFCHRRKVFLQRVMPRNNRGFHLSRSWEDLGVKKTTVPPYKK